jgi:hypothetical protein
MVSLFWFQNRVSIVTSRKVSPRRPIFSWMSSVLDSALWVSAARVSKAALHSSERPFPGLKGLERRVDGTGSVLIGRDTRESGPRIQAALEKGLLSQGVNVIDVGIAPTPAPGSILK